MVDAHASGACEAIHGGSSPLLGTQGPIAQLVRAPAS
jgi:hypothetical protein